MNTSYIISSLRQAHCASSLRWLLAVASLLLPVPSNAQMGPTITVGYEAWPATAVSDLKVTALGPPGASSGDATVGIQSGTVRLSYPVALRQGKTLLSTQLGVQHIRFDYDEWIMSAPTADAAYLADISVAVRQQLSPRWGLLMQVSPAVATGGDGPLVREDVTVQGAALATRQVGMQSSVGIGAAYSTAFGAPIPLPIIQVERWGTLWSGGPTWRGTALLPANLEVWAVASSRLELGLQARALGSRHHLGRRGAPLGAPYAEAVNLVVGPSVIVRLTPWIQLGVESGVSLYRQMRVTDGRDEVLRFEPGPTGFVRTQVVIGG